jgi:hypothetical protein
MTSDNLHTFAILAYKESDYIVELIESLLAQTIRSNIYLSTSTPNDLLRDISRKYDIELKVHSNNGMANDWNFALSQCKTKYLTLAHQDDIYKKNYTEEFLNSTKNNPHGLIYFSNYDEIKNNQLITCSILLNIKKLLLFPFLFKKKVKNKFFKKLCLLFGSPIPCPSVMFDIENLNGFEFNTEFDDNLDWEAWIRMSEMKGSFQYIKKSLMIHRIHSESFTTNAIHNNIRFREDLILFKRLWGEYLGKMILFFYKLSYLSNK